MKLYLNKGVFLVLLLAFCLPQELFSQITPRSLELSDYKGVVDINSPHDAMTYWNVKYRFIFTFTGDTVNLKVNPVYSLKEISWVKPEKASARLLNHERGHFKFAELLALEFEHQVRQNIFLKNNFKAKLDSIFNEILKKYVDMELKYDLETRHMINSAAQKNWDEKLEESRNHFMKQKLNTVFKLNAGVTTP